MLKIKEDIVFTNHQDGSIVVLSVLESENCFYKITGLSRKIFTALSTSKDLKTIREEILAQFNVDEATLDKDIEQFVTYLKANNIVEEQ